VFEFCDWIGLAGLVIGVLGFGYAVLAERRDRKRLDITHSFLVGLKTGIEGPNMNRVIYAIDDHLMKLKK
jgi:hypothetical protein